MSTDMLPLNEPGAIVIDGISYIPSNVLLTGIVKVSLKDNQAFGVIDFRGEAPRSYSSGSELGFYFNDTRYLSIWEMTINGQAAVPLAHELRFGGSVLVFSMTNRDFQMIGTAGRIPRDTFLIRRVLSFYLDSIYETVEIKNFSGETQTLQIEQWAGGRFDDIFEVRGFTRPSRGRMLSPEDYMQGKECISVLQYEGLDHQIRKTYIHRFFEAEKIRVSPTLVGHFIRIDVPPKDTISLKTIISFDRPSDGDFHGVAYGGLSVADQFQAMQLKDDKVLLSSLLIHSDNAIVNRAIANARTDIHMLLTQGADNEVYPYAGIPWFSAAFGRDGIITAYQLLPWYPNVARGVIDYALTHLGKKVDSFTDEQPGKVFHEMRRGEVCKTRELPFGPYYGSVDSTPLLLILISEYIRWSLDREKLQAWWPRILEAMQWIDKWGDSDGDGFVEYMKQSPRGLVNQGWKDSHDSIMHADGVLAEPPIRLCEVQGYVFQAKMAMSGMARFLDLEDVAINYRREALQLKERFREKFWDAQGKYIYLALDGTPRPCDVRSSNMGQCLWSQIVSTDQATDISEALMSESMFSGHGIRTLSSQERNYNPLSYHNGSIWPHDNSLIMEGFRFYGQTQHLENLALAFIGVLEASNDFRLPELFCGFRKRGVEPPIPYDVACKPQAWAAGSVFLMLKAMLGLSMDIDQSFLVFNSPLLTPKINTLEIKNLQGRDWEIDLLVRRAQHGTVVEVVRKSGDLRVLTVK